MRVFFAVPAFALLAACGGHTDPVAKAKAQEATIVAATNRPGPQSIKSDETSGCKDRAESTHLVAASKKDDKSDFIKLWADGMKTYRCRGFAQGLGVTVTKTDAEGWACILPADDPENKDCFWIEPGRAG